jgi:hypothetical protein
MGKIERGERNVTLLNVIRIAAALDHNPKTLGQGLSRRELYTLVPSDELHPGIERRCDVRNCDVGGVETR